MAYNDAVASLDLDHDVHTGNAAAEGPARHGWFLGHFLEERHNLRSTRDVEMKWGHHAAGEGQDEWTVNRHATTLSILISGRDRISFPYREVVLRRPGDYVIWAPGIPHRWRAEEESVVLTVRWPSVSDDSVVVDNDAVVEARSLISTR
ncbi:MAG: signal peptidase I [Thermomicrobiales bacterium]